MDTREIDHAIRQLAARQHGVFSIAQLNALGVHRDLPARRVRQGLWQRLSRTVFALAGTPETWLRSLKAAELSVSQCALIGRPALELYRLPAGRKCSPVIVVGGNASSRSPLARVHRSNRALPTQTIDGIRVVTPDEAILHAASFLGGMDLERNLDDAMLRGLVSHRRLERLLHRAGDDRPRGIALLRPLVAERGPGWIMPESQLESMLAQVVRGARVPPHQKQATFPWLPGQAGRVDMVIPDWRLILEADGRHWHARIRAFEADRTRDNLAMANGYGVMRFTAYQLQSCRAEVIGLIEAAGHWRAAA